MKIIQGKQARPRRVLCYGVHGIGKSTWAAGAEAPIVIQTEDGLDDIGVDRSPLCTSFGDVSSAFSWLLTNEHEYRTCVIDSLDWLERLVWKATCEKHGKQSIEDFGYGKGYQLALRGWQWMLDNLQALRDQRGMTIVLLAHAKISRFENPSGDSYDRYEPDLHKSVSPLLQEWCDEVFFAGYEVATIKQDEGFGRERARAIGGGDRVCHTTEMPTHLAKRRIVMPDKIGLSWAEYQRHWPGNVAGIVRDGSSKQQESK